MSVRWKPGACLTAQGLISRPGEVHPYGLWAHLPTCHNTGHIDKTNAGCSMHHLQRHPHQELEYMIGLWKTDYLIILTCYSRVWNGYPFLDIHIIFRLLIESKILA